MRRIVVILIILVVTGSVGYWFFGRGVFSNFLNPKGQIPPSNFSEAGTLKFPNAPEGETIILGTAKGNVQIRNPYKRFVDTYEELLTLKDLEEYMITYSTGDSSFTIVLFKTTGEVRERAENDLVGILGVSRTDACKLSVVVNIAPHVNNGIRDHRGLSFCPRAVQ